MINFKIYQDILYQINKIPYCSYLQSCHHEWYWFLSNSLLASSEMINEFFSFILLVWWTKWKMIDNLPHLLWGLNPITHTKCFRIMPGTKYHFSKCKGSSEASYRRRHEEWPEHREETGPQEGGRASEPSELHGASGLTLSVFLLHRQPSAVL